MPIFPHFYAFFYILILRDFFLALWGVRVRGVINIWRVKPFETVPVIKGYINII